MASATTCTLTDPTPVCPIDVRLTRCNLLAGATHPRLGTALIEAKTGKLLLYPSPNDPAHPTHARTRTTAPEVLLTLPEEGRLVRWGTTINGSPVTNTATTTSPPPPPRTTPLLVATTHALYIYLVTDHGVVLTLAVRAPLDDEVWSVLSARSASQCVCATPWNLLVVFTPFPSCHGLLLLAWANGLVGCAWHAKHDRT
jgi:hypothetical protein